MSILDGININKCLDENQLGMFLFYIILEKTFISLILKVYIQIIIIFLSIAFVLFMKVFFFNQIQQFNSLG